MVATFMICFRQRVGMFRSILLFLIILRTSNLFAIVRTPATGCRSTFVTHPLHAKREAMSPCLFEGLLVLMTVVLNLHTRTLRLRNCCCQIAERYIVLIRHILRLIIYDFQAVTLSLRPWYWLRSKVRWKRQSNVDYYYSGLSARKKRRRRGIYMEDKGGGSESVGCPATTEPTAMPIQFPYSDICYI